MAAYEVLNAFVTNAANDTLHIVAKLSDVILQRLENTLPMQQQIVSVEDRITLEEVQTSLISVLLVSEKFVIGDICQPLTPKRPSLSGWKRKSSLKLIGLCMFFYESSTLWVPNRVYQIQCLLLWVVLRTHWKRTLLSTWTHSCIICTMHSVIKKNPVYAPWLLDWSAILHGP